MYNLPIQYTKIWKAVDFIVILMDVMLLKCYLSDFAEEDEMKSFSASYNNILVLWHQIA